MSMGGHHHHHHLHAPASENGYDGDARYRDIRRVTLIGSAVDLALGVAKIVVGFVGNSQALIADGVHSLSDLATDFMVLVAAKHGSRDADEQHPYGHGRFETLATVALGIALVGVAAGIAWDAAERLFHPEDLLHPGIWALSIAAVSIVAKEWAYRYTMRLARRLKSRMLAANAWHSRSDAISSVVVVIGVAGSMAGLDYLDAVAAVLVGVMIAKIGWDLAWQSVHELVDAALDPERVALIRQEILEVGGVQELHMLRTRMMGGEALVDVHIIVEPRLSVSEGHYIGETVRKRLIEVVDEVVDVTVHIDPEDDEKLKPSLDLPPRRWVEQELRQRWAGIDLAQRIERIGLHYLAGELEVEIYLTGTEAETEQQMIEALSQATFELEMVRSVCVYFTCAPKQ